MLACFAVLQSFFPGGSFRIQLQAFHSCHVEMWPAAVRIYHYWSIYQSTSTDNLRLLPCGSHITSQVFVQFAVSSHFCFTIWVPYITTLGRRRKAFSFPVCITWQNSFYNYGIRYLPFRMITSTGAHYWVPSAISSEFFTVPVFPQEAYILICFSRLGGASGHSRLDFCTFTSHASTNIGSWPQNLPRPGEDFPPSLSLLPYPRRYLYFWPVVQRSGWFGIPYRFYQIVGSLFWPVMRWHFLVCIPRDLQQIASLGPAPTPVWLEFAAF